MMPVAVSDSVNGWGEVNTMFTGEGQTYTADDGSTRPFNASNPHYCQKGSKYTKDYNYGYGWIYKDIECLEMNMAAMFTMDLPASIYIVTFIQRTEITSVGINPENPDCNTNTPEAQFNPDWGSVTCSKVRNFFSMNPEGLKLFLTYSFTATITHGDVYKGSVSGIHSVDSGYKKDLQVFTILRDSNGNIRSKLQPGTPLVLSISEILSLAGTSLDERAPRTSKSSDPAADPLPTFNRMTGMYLQVKMNLINYGMEDLVGATATYLPWNMHHDFICEITVERMGDWTSMGPRIVNFDKPATFSEAPINSNIKQRETVMIEQYAQTIQLVFLSTSDVAFYSFQLLFNKIIEGVVLLGVSVQVTKLIANHFLQSSGTSQIFSRYQNTEVNVKRAKARTAALAGLQTDHFFTSFDRDKTGHMSNLQLFRNLRLVLGDPKDNTPGGNESMNDTAMTLTLSQIAMIVHDVSYEANKHGVDHQVEASERVSLNEYAFLTGDDSCSLHNLHDLYGNIPGNDEYLTYLMGNHGADDFYQSTNFEDWEDSLNKNNDRSTYDGVMGTSPRSGDEGGAVEIDMNSSVIHMNDSRIDTIPGPGLAIVSPISSSVKQKTEKKEKKEKKAKKEKKDRSKKDMRNSSSDDEDSPSVSLRKSPLTSPPASSLALPPGFVASIQNASGDRPRRRGGVRGV